MGPVRGGESSTPPPGASSRRLAPRSMLVREDVGDGPLRLVALHAEGAEELREVVAKPTVSLDDRQQFVPPDEALLLQDPVADRGRDDLQLRQLLAEDLLRHRRVLAHVLQERLALAAKGDGDGRAAIQGVDANRPERSGQERRPVRRGAAARPPERATAGLPATGIG